jgi:hypothetical protein
VEEVLGFWALALTMSMSFVIVVWLCCSIVVSLLKAMQLHKIVRYKALLRENQRLKQLLADTAKERYFQNVHRNELVRRKSKRGGRSVA